jgi:hypothetical protein
MSNILAPEGPLTAQSVPNIYKQIALASCSNVSNSAIIYFGETGWCPVMDLIDV